MAQTWSRCEPAAAKCQAGVGSARVCVPRRSLRRLTESDQSREPRVLSSERRHDSTLVSVAHTGHKGSSHISDVNSRCPDSRCSAASLPIADRHCPHFRTALHGGRGRGLAELSWLWLS